MIRIVFGSEDSIDIDVMYFIDKLPTIEECKKFCAKDKLENRNLAVVQDGKIVDCFKGTMDEVNNMLIDTYSLHPQEYECPVTKRMKRDIPMKCIRAVRGILSILSKTSYRKEIKKDLQSNWTERLNVLEKINFENIFYETFEKETKADVLKLLAFQMGQTMALFDEKELYTKKMISEEYPLLESYLYRKAKDGKNLELFKKIFLEKMKSLKVKELGKIVEFLDYNEEFDIKYEKKLEKDL